MGTRADLRPGDDDYATRRCRSSRSTTDSAAGSLRAAPSSSSATWRPTTTRTTATIRPTRATIRPKRRASPPSRSPNDWTRHLGRHHRGGADAHARRPWEGTRHAAGRPGPSGSTRRANSRGVGHLEKSAPSAGNRLSGARAASPERPTRALGAIPVPDSRGLVEYAQEACVSSGRFSSPGPIDDRCRGFSRGDRSAMAISEAVAPSASDAAPTSEDAAAPPSGRRTTALLVATLFTLGSVGALGYTQWWIPREQAQQASPGDVRALP